MKKVCSEQTLHSSHHLNRRSLRLPYYDYSQSGAYFVTICCKNRACMFGEVVGGKMVLNGCGNIARDEWLKTAELRANVELGEFVIMPNHVHGIIIGICLASLI